MSKPSKRGNVTTTTSTSSTNIKDEQQLEPENKGFDKNTLILVTLFISACTFMFLVLYNFPALTE